MTHWKPVAVVLLIAGALTVLLPGAPPSAAAATLPREISDAAFWQMVSNFSEQGGVFRFQFMSNEREFATVVPKLKMATKPGGVYLGVGPEQNFTYIAALKPVMAIIIDIRHGNLDVHLMYKALFELSKDRSDFVARLFSRKRASNLTAKSTANEIFFFCEPDIQKSFIGQARDRATYIRVMSSVGLAEPQNRSTSENNDWIKSAEGDS